MTECVKWSLTRGEKQWKIINHRAQKVVAVTVAYRRWSFTGGSNCNALTGKILVFWIGGRLWEMVAYERWSHMAGQLYNINPENFYLCLPNSCSDYFPAFLLIVTKSPQTWEVHTAPENCSRATLNKL